METLFNFINLTLLAKVSVDKVYAYDVIIGLTFAIRWVFEFPPKASFNKNVSFESR